MRTSREIDKIAPAFLAAQKAMQGAPKSATNPHFKSKYPDLATVIEAVKEPLNAVGIGFLQTITNDTTGVMVETTLLHESGQWLAETQYLPVPQQTPQAFGSGITYAKRYGLQSMCGLPSEDDDGERASQPEKENAHRVEPLSNADKRKPIKEAKDELDERQQKELADLATELTDMIRAGEDAFARFESKTLSDGQKMELWGLMPRVERDTLRKAVSASILARGSRAPNLIPPSDLASQP